MKHSTDIVSETFRIGIDNEPFRGEIGIPAESVQSSGRQWRWNPGWKGDQFIEPEPPTSMIYDHS